MERFPERLRNFGEPGGTRTRDPLIKSQMLYQLSYRPACEDCRTPKPPLDTDGDQQCAMSFEFSIVQAPARKAAQSHASSIFSNCFSSITATPSSWALSSFEPASAP